MKVDIEQPADWSRRLTITVPAERVDQERRQVASQIASRVKLPGFRKGKVPASVIQRQYGPSIEQETIERVVNNAYKEALQQEGISPISEASVDDVDYSQGAELSFKVQFEVRPEITLDRLGGFTVKKPATAVGEEEVDRVVDRLREENASWEPLESGKPAEGDRVRVAITPLEEGGERPEPREYEVVLGAGEILEDIDQSIRTLEVGDEGEFTISLPDQSDGEDEADDQEDHRIHLRLISAERPDLPEADDEFASGLGAEFETMDALRARIREDLEAESERETDREVRRQLMGQIIDANPFEVPPSLVSQYLDGLLQAPEDADPQELEAAREQAAPAAEYGVRRMLIIDRVAQLENLHATQEDVEARVQEIAESNEMDANDVRAQLMRSGRLQALASDLTEARVFDYLKSLSTIETEDA
ncbi:MAG TPA: trigger factor [Longimicrobiales bacterium]|nr:trigger factor [Longimicrobiales bacterium]